MGDRHLSGPIGYGALQAEPFDDLPVGPLGIEPSSVALQATAE